MKKLIEKWAVRRLYLSGFPNHARISKIKKRVIFHPTTWVFFKMFAEPKQWFYIRCLCVCGYTFHEAPWCPWAKQNAPQCHTKGEILDILWGSKMVGTGIKPLPSLLSEESPLNE